MDVLDDLPKEKKPLVRHLKIRTPMCNLIEEIVGMIVLLDTVYLLGSIFYYKSITLDSQEVFFYTIRLIPAIYVFLWRQISCKVEYGKLITMVLLTPLIKTVMVISFILVGFTGIFLFLGILTFFKSLFSAEWTIVLGFLLTGGWVKVYSHYLKLTFDLSTKYEDGTDGSIR